MSGNLHVRTPLIESSPLSRRAGRQILLKLENTQPTGSFKIRGIGALCRWGRENGARSIVSSSGGNAGYAAAYAGRRLGMPATVYVPGSTSSRMQRRIEEEGATVRVVGAVWDEAHEAALAFARDTQALYVSPFDHPRIWEGHSTLVDEVVEEAGLPEAVVVSVGGGGLLCGVVEGLRRHGGDAVPVVAVETEGTASLAAALREGRLATLEQITGVATSLGARTVCRKALEWGACHPVRSVVVPDDRAIRACLGFADDHRFLVEPACGASLAVAYQTHPSLADAHRVVVVVCGGIAANLETLQEWRCLLAD